MAPNRFNYVRDNEAATDPVCVPGLWIVVRIDGKGFHKFCDEHKLVKPNDNRCLGLMTEAAITVMSDFGDIMIAYGQSDEYSFVFHKETSLYNRRTSKLLSTVVSLFGSSFVFLWSQFFSQDTPLLYAPSFDARVVLYTDEVIKDYLRWRQVDCHINNQYNTCFWKLVSEAGLTLQQAQQRLKGTVASDKNELLFSEFHTNYNDLPEIHRKGTVLIRDMLKSDCEKENLDFGGVVGTRPERSANITMKHVDLIGEKFWTDHPYVLGVRPKTSKVTKTTLQLIT